MRPPVPVGSSCTLPVQPPGQAHQQWGCGGLPADGAAAGHAAWQTGCGVGGGVFEGGGYKQQQTACQLYVWAALGCKLACHACHENVTNWLL
jgi:hypothetical protein